jgi:hypothetical protein
MNTVEKNPANFPKIIHHVTVMSVVAVSSHHSDSETSLSDVTTTQPNFATSHFSCATNY